MQILPPPGPERRRQVLRLTALLVILAGVVWYWSGPAVPAAPTSNRAGSSAAVPGGQLPVPDALRMDALGRESALEESGRNPFVFGQRQPAAVPGSAFLTTPQPGLPGASSPPAPAQPQGPPPIPLRLTGLTVITEGGRTLATLKDPTTSTLYQAVEGDIVDGRYRVVKIGVESVVISYLDGSGIRTLALGR